MGRGNKSKKNTGGRGRGRGPGRGRGRGRGRGAGGAGEERPWATPGADAAEPSTSRQDPPAPRTIDEDLALMRARRVDTTRALKALSQKDRKAYTASKRAKELEIIRLPDAPVPKRARKNSPQRVPCRLVVGTPSTPPQPKPQSWQVRPLTPSEPASSAPSPLVCDFTSGGLLAEDSLFGLLAPPDTTATEVSGLPSAVEVSPLPVRRQASAASSDDASAPVVIIVSAPAAAPARTDPGLPGSSRGVSVGCTEGQAKVSDWLDTLSDSDEEDFSLTTSQMFDTLAPPEHDFAADAPAFATDDLDAADACWLMQQDEETDRVVRQNLTDDQLTFDWSYDVNSFRGQREEFRGQSGPQFLIDDNTKPSDVFLKYFDDEVLDVIVVETNRQIDGIKATPLGPKSRFNDVARTDRAEMLRFTAMLILQGLCPLPVKKEYWQSEGHLGLSNYRLLMSYNRFMQLKKMLHFSHGDVTNMSVDDVKLQKLGPLLNLLNSRFSELYLPSRDIAIDESLLKWHGRLGFAQKIATKAAKVGVKSYELCDSKSGYLWKFFIYTGKGHTHGHTDGQTDNPDAAQEQVAVPSNLTAKIVIDLVTPLLNRGHTLTMDNFYNSPLLARFLKANGTDCLGTLRVNREFVPESIKGVSKSEMRPGDVVQSYCRDISILLWRDKNIVSMISTYHRGEVGGKEKYGHYKYKPQAVLDYNLSMGGVDKKDQLLSSHPIERVRNQAWYKKVYRRLLNTTVLNAYIAFRTHFPRHLQRQFRKTLADELIERSNLSIGIPRQVEVVRVIRNKTRQRFIVRGNHFVGLGATRFPRCVWCKAKRTKYICKLCEVALCVEVCFEAYHTE